MSVRRDGIGLVGEVVPAREGLRPSIEVTVAALAASVGEVVPAREGLRHTAQSVFVDPGNVGEVVPAREGLRLG